MEVPFVSTAAPENTPKGPPRSSGYEIARPRGACLACQKPIAADEKFMANLRETPEGFERQDICRDCWPAFDRAGSLGFWQTVMPRAQEKKKVFVDDEVLCTLFERLADAAEPAKIHFRFVLGLILMRKRMLVYETSRTEGDREIWSVRFRGRQDLLEMLNPKLNEEQVMEVSRQLGQVLNEDL